MASLSIVLRNVHQNSHQLECIICGRCFLSGRFDAKHALGEAETPMRSIISKIVTRALPSKRHATTATQSATYLPLDFLVPAFQPTDFFMPSYFVQEVIVPPAHRLHTIKPKHDKLCVTFLARPQLDASTRVRATARSVSSASALATCPSPTPSTESAWNKNQELRIAWHNYKKRGQSIQDALHFLSVADDDTQLSLAHFRTLAHDLESSTWCIDSSDRLLVLERVAIIFLSRNDVDLSHEDVQRYISRCFDHRPDAPLKTAWHSCCSRILDSALQHPSFENVIKFIVLPYWTLVETLSTDPNISNNENIQKLRLHFAQVLIEKLSPKNIQSFLDNIDVQYPNSSLPSLFMNVLLQQATNPTQSKREQIRILGYASLLYWRCEDVRLSEPISYKLALACWRRRLFESAWAVRWSLDRKPDLSKNTKRLIDQIYFSGFRTSVRDVRPHSMAALHSTVFNKAKQAFDEVLVSTLAVPQELYQGGSPADVDGHLKAGKLLQAAECILVTFPLRRLKRHVHQVLYALARVGEKENFLRIWSEYQAIFRLDPYGCNARLVWRAVLQDEAGAIADFKNFFAAGVKINQHMFTTLISLLVEVKNWKEIDNAFRMVVTLPELTFDIGLINTQLKAQIAQKAPLSSINAILAKIEDLDLRADDYTIALTLEALTVASVHRQARSFFDTLVDPTIHQFAIMVKGAYMQRKDQLAETYIQQMVDNDLQPNAIFYGQLITAKLRSGEFVQAQTLLDEYLALLSSARQDPDIEDTRDAENRRLAQRAPLNAILSPFVSPKRQISPETRRRTAAKIMNYVDADPLPDYRFSVLRLHCQQQNAEKILNAWDELLAVYPTDPSTTKQNPSYVTKGLTLVTESLAICGRFQAIGDIWLHLYQTSFPVDWPAWNALAQAMVSANHLKKAADIVEHLLLGPPRIRREAVDPIMTEITAGLIDGAPSFLVRRESQSQRPFFAMRRRVAKQLFRHTIQSLRASARSPFWNDHTITTRYPQISALMYNDPQKRF